MASYLPKSPDNVSVKVSTIKSVISFVNSGDYAKALEYLETLIDFKFRADFERRKNELLFLIEGSTTSAENARWHELYRELTEKSLF